MFHRNHIRAVALVSLVLAASLRQLCTAASGFNSIPTIVPSIDKPNRDHQSSLNTISKGTDQHASTAEPDTSLYSRQLFVYGKSAQQKLQNSHILIIVGSLSKDLLLADEVIKNLALAGVGELSLCYPHSPPTSTLLTKESRRLIGREAGLLEYAQALNPQLKVHSVEFSSIAQLADSANASRFTQSNSAIKSVYSAVLCTGCSRDSNGDASAESESASGVTCGLTGFGLMLQLSRISRSLGLPFVACSVYGCTGYIFDDFSSNFVVDDVEGESSKEIPLYEKAELLPSTGSEIGDSVRVRVESIEEERLDVGLGDYVQLLPLSTLAKREQRVGSATSSGKLFNQKLLVVQVESTRACVLEVHSRSLAEELMREIRAGNIAIKKAKQSAVVRHKPLVSQLLRPTFAACNECLPKKKDFALSMALLASMKAHEHLRAKTNTLGRCLSSGSSDSGSHSALDSASPHSDSYPLSDISSTKDRYAVFRRCMEEELKAMGVVDPTLPWRAKAAAVPKTAPPPSSSPSLSSSSSQSTLESPKRNIGNVGLDIVDYVARRFFSGAASACPATASVVGSIAAQECIKAITHMHMPASQFLMFESLDSVDPLATLPMGVQREEEEEKEQEEQGQEEDEEEEKEEEGNGVHGNYSKEKKKMNRDQGELEVGMNLKGALEAVYGKAVVDELAAMKVFIVGSGAIGCELLKNFALMGVAEGRSSSFDISMRNSSRTKLTSRIIDPLRTGQCTAELVKATERATVRRVNEKQKLNRERDARSEETVGDFEQVSVGSVCESEECSGDEQQGLWRAPTHGLSEGGIVLTDMDHIERSNLNRQLLFRERHIGQSKSLVAAEVIREVNPKIRVLGLPNRVGPDTEAIFDAQFWSDTDVVVTALDNVDARLYVDGQCVNHAKWMVDSGTLGTKGNTQVVIPHVSESYTSSADPPEEAVPLCTLKSFPYLPEHSVSWAKSKFEFYYSKEVRLLRDLLAMWMEPLSAGKGKKKRKAIIAERQQSIESWLNAQALPRDELVSLLMVLRDISSSMIHVPSNRKIGRESDGESESEGESSSESDSSGVSSAANTLVDDSGSSVLGMLLEWGVREFRRQYEEEVFALLREHPADEVDDEGTPFWGGSRRIPSPVAFDPSEPLHRDFVLAAAYVRARVLGLDTCELGFEARVGNAGLTLSLKRGDALHEQQQLPQRGDEEQEEEEGRRAEEVLAAVCDHLSQQGIEASIGFSPGEVGTGAGARAEALADLDVDVVTRAILAELASWEGRVDRSVGLRFLALEAVAAEDFEKDDALLGHVAFVEKATNLRCRVYSIKEIDTLEVQKIAGNIIPALATTTSLVSGLVSLELVKIASERVAEKRRQRMRKMMRSASSSWGAHADRSIADHHQQQQQQQQQQLRHTGDESFAGKEGIVSWWSSLQTSGKRLFLGRDDDDAASAGAAWELQQAKAQAAEQKEEERAEKERLLAKFRNGFVNLARPMLAFAQPVEADSFYVNDVPFTMWDQIEAPRELSELSIRSLARYLHAEYRVTLQSVSFQDALLYADFLPGAEEQLDCSLLDLMRETLGEVSIESLESLEDKDQDRDRNEEDRSTASAVDGSIKGSSDSSRSNSSGVLDGGGEVEGGGTAADDEVSAAEAALQQLLQGRTFLDFEISCCSLSGDSDTNIDTDMDSDLLANGENEVKMPPVRVRVGKKLPPTAAFRENRDTDPESIAIEVGAKPEDFAAQMRERLRDIQRRISNHF